MPYSVSGITERNYHGTGLVLDAERGLIVVDRNTVPASVGDVSITFAGTVQVPGRVVYIHPLHNLALVAYDPKLIGATPVKAAKLADARAARRRERAHRGARRRQRDPRAHARRSPTSNRSSCRCRAPCVFATAISRWRSSSIRRPITTACCSTRTSACSACGRALPMRTAARLRRTIAASRSIW